MQYKYMRHPETNELVEDMILGMPQEGLLMFIPNNPDNRDWKEYQEWLALGNEPLPPDEE